MKVGLFACQVCFIGAAPRNEHPPQSMHKDCVSLRILDILHEALCAEMLIIIAQGLPERPHHVLGNLWIKIAGWLKRSGLSKHKQSGLTNMVDWLWFGFLPRQLWGLAVFSSELHLGVYTKLKCRTSRDWCPSHCLCFIRIWFVRYPVHIALFFYQPVRSVPWEPLLLAQGLVCRHVSGSWREGSDEQSASSSFCFVKQLRHRSRHVLSYDRCHVKREPFIGCLNCHYITEGVLHSYLIHSFFFSVNYALLPYT